ncbi:MAG: PhnE/PtxC family ABC transporter permease [Trueperaceae bacterium]
MKRFLTNAASGTSIHVFLFAVVPQVLTEFLSNLLYRFEINLRAAAVLGLVGAGGIGLPLIQRLQFRRWDEVSMFLIVIATRDRHVRRRRRPGELTAAPPARLTLSVGPLAPIPS